MYRFRRARVPENQRPITALDVVHRVWAKGIVMAWAPILHREYLGRTVMVVRALSLHLAHLLQNLIWLQKHLATIVAFDLEKMFSFAAVVFFFDVSTRVGVAECTVRCLRGFYRQLREWFRYVDGSEWFMANGLAQDCPASPDLMNILLSRFIVGRLRSVREWAVGDTFNHFS